MNFGTSRTKTKYEYKMNNQTLETVKHNPYLGVELTDNLEYNDHIDTMTSKASRVLGFVKRNLKHCPRTVNERAYQTLVRPKLEYRQVQSIRHPGRQCYYFPVSNANSGGWQNINIGHSGVWKVYVNYFAQFHVFHVYIDLIIVDLLI